MKNGVAYLTFTDGNIFFLLRKNKQDKPLMHFEPADSIADGIRTALGFAEKNDITIDRAVLSIDGRMVVLRNYMLPIKRKSQLGQAVAFEMADDIPFDAEEVVIDHFRGFYGEGFSHVSAVAAKKDYISEIMAVFREFAVCVEKIDVDVAAFAKACSTHFANCEFCVGLEIGQDRTLFCRLCRGNVLTLAVIPWGEGLLARAVARDCDIPLEEVDRVLIFDSLSGERIDEVVAGLLDDFVRRLLREVYRLSGNEQCPSHFVLSGNVIRVQNFRNVFAAVADSEVHVWEECCFSLGDEIDEGQRGSGLASGFGTAEDSGPGFNFRKGEFAVPGTFDSWRRDVVFLCLVFVALMVAWGGYAYATLMSGQREFVYLNEAMLQVYRDALPGVSEDLAPVQYQSILTSKIDILSGDSRNASDDVSMSVIETLKAISVVLDKKIDVELLNLSLDGRRIDIQGETKTMNEVDVIRSALTGRANVFKDVNVKNAIVDKRAGKVRFEIEVLR